MTPERWVRLSELFEAALDREPAARTAFLASACPDDHALRHEVERLIEAHERAGDFGTTPAFHVTPVAVVPSCSEAPSKGTLEAGYRLGRYEILSLVGSGGMGEVYRAIDPQLGRQVGIKVLRRRDETTTEQLKRFQREARAVGALNHPHILSVHDTGVADGIPYVVSELLEGRTLRAELAEGPLPFTRTHDIALQIAEGLAAAHDKAIVHRDLKPDNLFVTTDGIVKILDFGLAKQTGPFPIRDEDDGSSLTELGLVIGTAGYMSPEQVRGWNADARSDVFAFGAVLYEMLTGVRAFTGDSVVETMNAILTTSPSAMSRVPAPFVPIVQQCLEMEADRRYGSMRDVQAALESVQLDLCQVARPSGVDAGPERAAVSIVASWFAAPRWRGAAVAVIAVAVVVAAIFVNRGDDPPGLGASGRPAIAVMPLDDRSGDPALAWLSEGVSSMLVTALAQTPGLDVIGTERLQAGFRELGREPSDRSARFEVARHGGAGAVLLGSFLKAGSEIRIEVQVQAVDTGRVVVARSEQGTDPFAIVDTIARDVRTALDLANRPGGRPLRDVTTTSLEAYGLYTKAQQARHNNRWGDARTLFEEALRVDPAFTLARAQMVTVLDRLGESASAQAGRQIVRSQLNRLPERQRLLAEAVQEYAANPSRALELLERLVERYPDEDEAYDSIIHAYTHARDPAHWQKALAFMERWARAIPGPGSGHFHNHYGYAYVEHRLFTEAEREFRAYIRVSPDEANGYDSLAELFLMTGRPAMAIETYDQALRLNPLFGWSHFGRAYAFAMQGRYDEALAAMATLQNLGSRAGVPGAVIEMVNAVFFSRVGRYHDAATHLNTARELARELGDANGEADADLVDATLALERDQHARAIQQADRAVRTGKSTPIDIMRARRAALAHLIAGIAEARSGRISAARSRLDVQRELDVGSDPIQGSWRQALGAEIALAEGRVDVAEAAFRDAEYQIVSSFAIYPVAVVLANNLPFRDGLARTALARGDLQRAIDVFRRLNQPDAASTWTAAFEPRYVLSVARLATRAGDREEARAEYSRFRALWSRADEGVRE